VKRKQPLQFKFSSVGGRMSRPSGTWGHIAAAENGVRKASLNVCFARTVAPLGHQGHIGGTGVGSVRTSGKVPPKLQAKTGHPALRYRLVGQLTAMIFSATTTAKQPGDPEKGGSGVIMSPIGAKTLRCDCWLRQRWRMRAVGEERSCAIRGSTNMEGTQCLHRF